MTDTSRKDTNSPDTRLIVGQAAFLYGLPEEHKSMNGLIVQIVRQSSINTQGLPCLPGEIFYQCRTQRIPGGLLLANHKYLAHLDIYDQDTIARYRGNPPKQLQLAK